MSDISVTGRRLVVADRHTGTKALLKEHGLSSRSPAIERFHALIDKNESGCWIWRGWRDSKGYGQFWVDYRNRRAHRWAYEQFVGPIPKDLTLDHLCQNRSCVNPEHLEPVTQGENSLRGDGNASKTHCKRGHEFTPENTYHRPRGERECRTCQSERRRRRTKGATA